MIMKSFKGDSALAFNCCLRSLPGKGVKSFYFIPGQKKRTTF